jgi:hypothetical protein
MLAAPWTADLSMTGANRPATPGLVPPSSISVLLSSSGVGASTPTDGVPFSGRGSVHVGEQDVSGVLIELVQSATVSGRVTTDDGSPLRDVVHVSLEGTGDPVLTSQSARVAPDSLPTGGFVIRGLLGGSYALDAASLTRQSLVVKSVTGPGGDYTDRPFVVTDGTSISGVVVTLTDQSAVLRGIVRDRDGGSVSESAVIVFPKDSSRWKQFGLTPAHIRSTLAIGREGYRLSRLRAGEYLAVAVDVSQFNAWHDSRFLQAAAAVASPVTLAWGNSAVLNLTKQHVGVR